MNISKLIAKLEALKEKHGDIPVLIVEHGFGGYAVHTTAENLNETKISPLDFENESLEDDNEFNQFKESHPDFKFETVGDRVTCVEIHGGEMIYAT